MSSTNPVASVVVPTRNRAEYLRETLVSLGRQKLGGDAYEILVVDDGSDGETAALVESFVPDSDLATIELVGDSAGRGLNAARNSGIGHANADLLILVDDDIDAPPNWLSAMVAAADRYPECEAFAGRIRVRLEGFRWPTCERQEAPITTLDLGDKDRDIDYAWGANMALRHSAFERIGPFREEIAGGGDEEEWEMRLRDGGGRIVYVADATLWHRRNRADSTLCSLSRAAYGRGRNVRRFDVLLGKAPPLAHELRVLAGCLWHTVRRRCAMGVVMAAHSAGRLREAMAR